MKKFIILLISALALVSAGKPVYEEYIERYSAIAIEEMNRTGVPASITLAQGLVESGAGQSTLARKGNNHFGIKCHRDWKGKTMRKSDDRPNECFRVYDTPEESFRDHSDFLRYYDRYKFLFDYQTTDYKSWCYGLKKAGYATAPNYATALIETIEKYNLSRFDTPDKEVVPQAPLKIEQAKPVDNNVVVPEADENYVISLSRVFEKNGVRMVYALAGETYSKIAYDRGLNPRQVMRYNDARKDRKLLAGEIVYIEPKKFQAPRGLEKYIVGSNDESLWAISQRFGIKLRSLMKMNGFSKDFVPEEGDTILLRK